MNLLRFHVLRVRSLVRSENCLRNRFIPSSTVKRGQNAQKPRKVGQMALAPKDQNNRSIPHRVINFSSKMKWRNQGPSISRRKPPKKSHNDPMPTLGYFRHNTGTFTFTVIISFAIFIVRSQVRSLFLSGNFVQFFSRER